jgi:hypothetical protein
MPRQYPTGFRDEMVRRMLTGEPVLTICSDTGVPEQTGVPPVWLTSICSVWRCWKDVCHASCLSGRVPS